LSESGKLTKQIQVELAQLESLMARHPQLLAKRAEDQVSPVEIDAVAALLHSFYTGIENIFNRISITLDGGPPKTDNWHIALLDSMASPAPNRGPVISETLRASLRQFLDFRHVFRHAYSFNLQWNKMAPLVAECQPTFARVKDELASFVKTLHV